jgi:hypothetical protein
VRIGGVAALAPQRDPEIVHRRADRARYGAQIAQRAARVCVNGINLADVEPVENAVPDHGLAAAAVLLGGLEEEDAVPAKLRVSAR